MRNCAIAVIVAAIAAAAALQADEARLSEIDKLRFRLHQTEIALEQSIAQAGGCRAQLRELQLTADQLSLKSDIEKRHPGYAFDPRTGVLSKKPD